MFASLALAGLVVAATFVSNACVQADLIGRVILALVTWCGLSERGIDRWQADDGQLISAQLWARSPLCGLAQAA